MDEVESLEAAIRELTDPSRVLRRVVEEALRLVPGAEGSAIEMADAQDLTYVCCAGSAAEATGLRLRRETSLSGLAIKLGETLRCDDARTDDRVDRAACERVGAVSMICVPLYDETRPVGVLKVSSSKPDMFNDRDVAVLAHLARFISVTITAASELSRITGDLLRTEAESCANGVVSSDSAAMSEFVANVLRPGAAHDLETRGLVEQLRLPGNLAVVYQPVMNLVGGTLAGVEALARFLVEPSKPPNVWFDDAHRVGLGVALELDAFGKALRPIDELPETCYIAANIGPGALVSPGFPGIVASVDPRRLVVELTEHVKVDDYPEVRRVLATLRRSGVRLAIDDTGAGFASFTHILKLAPDIIKLDLELTRGIDIDPVRRSLATALITFAGDTGATVIAEGIETQSELDTLRDLGIAYGQGYLLGRPMPASEIASSIELFASRC